MHPDSTVVDSVRGNYYENGTWTDSYYKFEIPARPQKFIIKAEHPDYQTTFVNYEIKYVARNTYFDAPWPLMKKVQGVLFTDTGYAWDKDTEDAFDIGSMKYSYGVGLRINSPLGPLRLDYGIGEDGGRFHFSFGGQF